MPASRAEVVRAEGPAQDRSTSPETIATVLRISRTVGDFTGVCSLEGPGDGFTPTADLRFLPLGILLALSLVSREKVPEHKPGIF